MTSEHQKFLDTYQLPPFREVLRDDFRDRFGLLPAQQYGIACRDVQDECDKAESLGAGPFINSRTAAPNWTENGQRVAVKLDFALGYAGDSQLEFLGPGEGTTFYSEALTVADTILHHIGVYQNESEKLEQRLNKSGYKTVISGGVSLGSLFGVKFKYFDTRNDLGCYLEILDFYVLGKISIPVRTPVEMLAKLRASVMGR